MRTPREVCRAAPAKINLYLAVLGRRSDGYHELANVMQTLDLADQVTVRRGNAPGISLDVRSDGTTPAATGQVPTGPDNLVVRAARAYLLGAGAPDTPVQIELLKRIPAGGGLGGGSSDAAATLLALHELLDGPVSAQDLSRMAAELGSDVPFFLAGGTALCTGRGELVTPLDPPRPFTAELLLAPMPVPTPAVYAALDAPPCPGPLSRADAAALAASVADADVDALSALFRNDLEAATLHVSPELGPWLRRPDVHLCGSGSTLFRFTHAECGPSRGDGPMVVLGVRSRNG